LRAGGWLLGLLQADPQQWLGEGAADDDQVLIEKYKEARKARDFAEADRIRDGFRARGYKLEVAPDGNVRVSVAAQPGAGGSVAGASAGAVAAEPKAPKDGAGRGKR
jgi:hypothetical protein